VAERAEQVLNGEYDADGTAALSGELGEPVRRIEELAEQQQLTHNALGAMIQGRFDAVPMQGETPRDLELAQLALRLKREYFRSYRGAVLEARERTTDYPELINMVLATVAQAVGAVAGAYYAVEESTLSRLASLGCEPQNDVEVAPLRVGDGLVGKVAATGEVLILEQLADKGVRVRSGLLELTPSALLLYPVRRDERVVGVMELLFLEASALTAREFLDYVGDEIARGPRVHEHSSNRIKELEEELVIANARIERMSADFQNRERVRAAGGGA
jgi:hypothetical protein